MSFTLAGIATVGVTNPATNRPATNQPVAVYVSGTNTLATLYQIPDNGAQIPLASAPTVGQPILSNSAGNVIFAAAPGDYDLYYGGIVFASGVPVAPDSRDPNWGAGGSPSEFSASQGVIYVNPGGSDSLSGETPANAKLTLAGAISALSGSQDTIVVGGSVAFGSSSTLTLPAGVRLIGSNQSQSKITLSTDFGSGQFAIICGGTGQVPNVIEDISIIGPGGNVNPTVGVAPAAMYGIKSAGGRLNNVYVAGFYAGVCFATDHDVLTNVHISNCYYGIYYLPNPSSAGNQKFLNVVLYSQARACVAIGNGNAMTGVSAIGLECGQAPVGFLFEAQTGNPAVISYSQFIQCGFESMGNAAFLDLRSPQLSEAINGCQWQMSGPAGFISNTQDSSLPYTYAVNCNLANLLMFFGATFGTPVGGTGVYSGSTLPVQPAGLDVVVSNATRITGTTAGTVYCSEWRIPGVVHQVVLYFSGYENTTATAQAYNFVESFLGNPATIANGTGTSPTVTSAYVHLPVSMSGPATGYFILSGQ